MIKRIKYIHNIKNFGYAILACFWSSGLNAQDNQDDIPVQISSDSTIMQQRDSILLQQINMEYLFRTPLAVRDSSFRTLLAVRDSSSFDRKEIENQLQTFPDNKRWRFGLNGGVALRIAPDSENIPPELLKYRKSLKFGSRFGVDATYFISPNVGLGANYSLFSTSNTIDYISYEGLDGNLYQGYRKDDINVHFFGPSISIRSIPRHNKIYASCDFSIGYSIYDNNMVFNDSEYDLTGHNFGFATSIGSDFMLSKNISIGVYMNVTAASLKKITIENSKIILSEDQTENLSRVSLSLTMKTYR
jgi:hypothetical protein